MILFSDFDKTLYLRGSDERTMANLEAIEKWREAGNLFCITTGRSYRSVTEQMPQIKNICDYCIVDGGSIVLSRDGKVLNAFYFEPKIVEEIAEISKTFSEIPILVYYTTNSEGLDYEVDGITKLRLWFKDVSFLYDVNEQLMNTFPVFAVFNSSVKSSIAGLEDYHGFVEVVPLESGKSNAIKFLAQKEKILPEKIVTIGDGSNDLGMVRDFDGFAIEKSELSNADINLKTASSLARLVENIL